MIGSFSGFMAAAPRQKVAGRKEGHVEKVRAQSTDGKGEGLQRRGRGCP